MACNSYGVNSGSSSMEMVLNWLTSGSNYQRWRGILKKEKLTGFIIEMQKTSTKKSVIFNPCITLLLTGRGTLVWEYSMLMLSMVSRRLMMCSDQIHFLCLAEPLHTQSSVSVPIPEAQQENQARRISTDDLLNLPSSGQDEPTLDEEEGGITTTQFIPPSAEEETIKHTKEVITKRQAKMAKAHTSATKAKVSYMRELRELVSRHHRCTCYV
ncbi:uncharacterized protein VP01_629g3 [Puccinia sorghi]|uniref:Uncharacterized protein n=1 Tax=Puccinia sorghi TaxID=27349 RepID=A0A0L6UGC9_9BASI|nr:uncharacterized protein VP01_629g3 [Puccinia sorghi]